ncbi:serine hydrolase domain-containing protein [Streptantibioticus parmotrematis]|uniref:serine hydrolase domain-containing protein n=1 Tax=Streptantibioticus parmotrematis TaxID=2873249 RepID=UPI0033D42556
MTTRNAESGGTRVTSPGGLSPARLERMHTIMSRHVERGDLPGLITCVSRRGETHVDVIGEMEFGPGARPMRRDTIFRISSMTKPVIAVATMILLEECVLRLDEPVDRLLPELADRRVLTRPDAPLDDTVAAERPITVRDLLTFRMGFGMLLGADDHPVVKAAQERGVATGVPNPAEPPEPDEWMRRLGELPLMAQPGERWLYNTGSQVLGVLIARASGQALGDFLRERIFEPLGMRDTGFHVPADRLDRLATSYMANHHEGGRMEVYDGVTDSQWATEPAFPDGAAGLVSTVDDYLAFGQMMLNEGELAGERVISRPSVTLMTTDHLTDHQKRISEMAPGTWANAGWGFGVSVVTGRDGIAATPGRYGWDGGLGTNWSSDPAERMVSIMMTQRAEFPFFSNVHRDFWVASYQSIAD